MYAAIGTVQVPRQAVTNVAVQLQGTILGQHTHGINAGIDTVGKGEVNDAILAAERNGGLGHVTGQSVQSAALSASQQHSHNFFFHAVSPLVCF